MRPFYRIQLRKVRKSVDQQEKECVKIRNNADRFADEFAKLAVVYGWALEDNKKQMDKVLHCLMKTDGDCSKILDEDRFEFVANRFQCAISSP